MVVHQLLDLLVAQFLTESCQQMPEFGGRDETARVLVEVTQAFNEVVGGVTRALLRYGLKDRGCDQNCLPQVDFELVDT